MAKAERFEDLFAWQDARQLRKEVSVASKKGEFAKDFEMRNQIRGAALSVMDNIAEGFECGTKKEFAQFLSIAKGSAGEVRSALYAALDDGYLTEAEFRRLCEQCLTVPVAAPNSSPTCNAALREIHPSLLRRTLDNLTT